MSNRKFYSLITGASEGLGKALAIECATRGMNLVLVALPGPELYELAEFIRRNFPVEVKVFEMDLSIGENCSLLHEAIQSTGFSINMLINNAGIGSTMFFDEGILSFYEKQIKLNVIATTLLTRLFVNDLKKNSPSHILNVGSLCSFFYLPKKQVYGGTKSFIYFFSKSLRRELKRDGITVSVLCPGGINTNIPVTLMNKTGSWLSRLSIMNPEEVAEVAIKRLLKGKEVIIPGRMNNFYMAFSKILPDFIRKMITDLQMKKLKPDSPLLKYLQPITISPRSNAA